MSSSVERNNPPPRRKSCEACRAAKRRCDLALPTCFRCTRRRVACVYPGLPAPDLVPELLALLGQPEALESPCVAQFTIDTPPIFEPVLLETHTQEPMRPPLVEHQPQTGPVSLIHQQCAQLTHVRTRPGLDLPDLIASRFQYAIDTLRDTPRRMVVENQTPWSHRELYADGMPKVMQDAYACCALYITKNSINAAMITSHILSRHHELVLSALPTSPSDLLAHTHALLLYRLMLVFDPDLSDAISGSTFHALSMSALESAAALLFSSTHFPPESETDSAIESRTSLLPSTLEQTMHFWKLWVFEESARRTVLFTFYCLQIVRLVCGDKMMECDGKLGLIHSWYFSAHLWNAPSALDFAVAWAEKEHFIVRNVNFTRVLREAQPNDVDCLGKMLLVTSQGVDRMREWFFARGAIL
ncbi:Zn(II)2Cys6 transcription factor domain-containing protein [Aspergillus lucknowensis]|uniref:Zn(2)-C6 fungal-type domain-containing protein n=1 Tax=Aspergillus lucknowensis TaxID=176173 RepID=A0ABR4M0V7_9EURO